MGLSKKEKDSLQYEIVPRCTRLKLTRLLRSCTKLRTDSSVVPVIQMNRVINVARTVLGLPVYVLEPDEWGEYEPFVIGWHLSELELVMRRPTTAEMVETIADLLQQELVPTEDVNSILEEDRVGVSFTGRGSGDDWTISVVVHEPIEASPDDKHPNIRILVSRMDAQLAGRDYSGVLHSSASIIETLAKDILPDERQRDKPLGKFFGKYRTASKLNKKVLDYMEDVYVQRNREPLAGHGSTRKPRLTKADAVVLCEMTKALVRSERQLAVPDIPAPPDSSHGVSSKKQHSASRTQPERHQP